MRAEARGLLSTWNVVSKFIQRGIAPVDYIESFLENVRLFLEQEPSQDQDLYSLLELCRSLDGFSASPYADVPPEVLEKLNHAASQLRKLIV